MKTIILSTLLTLTLSLPVIAAPIWKVEAGDHHLFIGGTVHNLSESDYPLPKAFEDIYERADKIYFEFDMSKINSPEQQTAILARMTYPEGESIASDLKADTLKALKSSLHERGIPFEKVSHLKASLMGLTLSSIESQRLGIQSLGVDQHFHQRASSDGKHIGWLESLDVQVATLASFGEGQEDEYIRYTLESLEDKQTIISDSIYGWRTADSDLLNSILLSPMKNRFPDVYDSAVIDRNNAWLPKIESMLEDSENELVLVGVLHLVGEDSLIRMLRDKGYKVLKLLPEA